MYEKLTDIEIKSHQKANKELPKDKLSLKDLNTFYHKEIMPFIYTYECEHALKVSFVFEEENLCHLLFGTPEKKYSKRKQYMGKLGYENIVNGITTIDTLPRLIYDKAIHRIASFILIKKVLEKPSLIIFNKNLVKQNGNKYNNSRIDAKFLLDRQLSNSNRLHLFLEQVGKGRRLVPNSFFPNDSANYVNEQISFKVDNIKIDTRQTDSGEKAM